MREYGEEARPDVHQLLSQLSRVDWVLVEGFKASDLPKIEVWRPAAGHAPRYPQDGHVLAVATDEPDSLPAPTPLPLLNLNQPQAVADWLLAHAARFEYAPEKHA